MVGERVTIMNILDLKRQLWAVHGALGLGSDTDGGADQGVGGVSGVGQVGGGGNGTGSGNGNDPTGFGVFGTGLSTPSVTNQTPGQESNVSITNSLMSMGVPLGFAQAIGNMATLGGNISGTQALAGIAQALTGLPIATAMKVAGAMGLSFDGKTATPDSSAKNEFGFSYGKGGDGADSVFSVSSPSTATTATQTPEEAAAAANKDPATLATSIANQSWNDWQGDKKALQGQVATNTARGNALYDSSMAAANGNMKLVTGMQDDYNNIYRPAGQQFANYVNMLGSKEYQDQQAGRATADVQQQADAQMNAAQRNLQRSGVNPNSGRMLSMANQNAIGTAAAQAGAANTSRRNTLSDWSTGLTKMADMGNATLNSAKGLDSSAQSWKTLGLNAGNTGFNQSSDLSKLSALNTSTSGGVAGTAANAIYNQGQLANSNAANQRANDAANPWTTIAGAIGTSAAKGIDWGSLFNPRSTGSGAFSATSGLPSSTDSDPLAFLDW